MRAAAAGALALAVAGCAAARADDPGYEVKVVVPAEVAPGDTAAVSVTVAPAAGRTISTQGPLRVDVDGDEALGLTRRRYLRKDAADPAADAPRFDVRLRPRTPGDRAVTVAVRFWLCARKTCRPIQTTRTAIVHVPAPPIDAGVDAPLDAPPPIDAGRARPRR